MARAVSQLASVLESDLTTRPDVVIRYHMKYAPVRTSMSLDHATLRALEHLAKRWSVSKSEVMRRAIRSAKAAVEREEKQATPLEALDWLQGGGGLSVREGEEFKAAVAKERTAKRCWWQTS
jgi:predicted transcriptional regulator